MLIRIKVCIMARHTSLYTVYPYTPLFRSRQATMRGKPQRAERIVVAQPHERRVEQRVEETVVLDRALAKELLNAALVGLRSEEHTSELQSRVELVCRLLPEKKPRFAWSTT